MQDGDYNHREKRQSKTDDAALAPKQHQNTSGQG
jgi:hypothetical protein